MRYLIALLCPPLAVLTCGKPFQSILNFFLTLCFYFPGALHAMLVVSSFQADRRARVQLDAIQEQTRELGRVLAKQAAGPAPTRPAIVDHGSYNVDVVGESHYQRHLEAVCGGRTRKGVNLDVEAVLSFEPENPADPMAVRVDVAGQPVGYLDRAQAREHRKRLARRGDLGFTHRCPARIVGGWDRGGADRGHFGVKLDVEAALAHVDVAAPPRPPLITLDAIRGACLATKDGAVRAYQNLPEWAQPITWGLAAGTAASVVMVIIIIL